MAGYYFTSRKRKAQGAHYNTSIDAYKSFYTALVAGIGRPPGVTASEVGTNRMKQSTTSFRSGRGESGLVLNPKSLLLENQETNLKPTIYDNGHTFRTRDEQLFVSHPRVTLRGNSGGFYQGPLLVSRNGGSLNWPSTFPNFLEWSTINPPADDITYGTKAMSIVMPAKSPASLVQFLLELRQDFPRLPLAELSNRKLLSKRRTTGAVADEWLNLQFGIVPSLQDIYKIAKTVIRCGKLIDQYYRDVGKMVRRNFRFDPIVTVQEDRVGLTNAFRAVEAPLGATSDTTWINSMFSDPFGSVSVSRKQTLTEKYSFAGAFTYYLDPLLGKLGSEGHFVQQAQYLLGLNLDLDTLYQLTPWTWMVDWFTNLGDVISITSRIAKHSLVLNYGYMMHESVIKSELAIDRLSFKNGLNYSGVKNDYVITTKTRTRSTPYGFGLNTATFSGVQWAILAALGMTSGEHQLRYL